MKFSIHSRAVLGVLGLVVLGPDAGAASVIANGSFELPAFTFAANVYVIRNTTNPTGWSRTGTSIAWYTDHLGFNPSDGMQFLEFEGFTAQLYQSFPTTPGVEYTVSFDYAPSGFTSGVDDAVSARIDGVERLLLAHRHHNAFACRQSVSLGAVELASLAADGRAFDEVGGFVGKGRARQPGQSLRLS